MHTLHCLKKWTSDYKAFVLALLVLILFVGVAQFVAFAMIQTYVKSYFGGQAEDVSFALMITYVGILTILPIQFRLHRYANPRNYLLVTIFFAILFNIGCLLSEDLILFLIFRFLEGITTCMIVGCMLIILFSNLKEDRKVIVGTSFFFGTILSAGILVGIISSWVVVRMDWRGVYLFLILLQILAIVITYLIFKPKRDQRPYPLYQIDWLGAIIFALFGTAVAFTMIYGPKNYWFESPMICQSAVLSGLLFILFIYRQSLLKRPLVDLRVFKYKKFIFGLVLLAVFYGIKDTTGFIYGYSAGVLKWSPSDIVNLGMFNVGGVIVGAGLAVKVIISNKKNAPKLLLLGFGILMVFHFWMYQLFTPDLNFYNLTTPVFLQGIAEGLLFAPIIGFCMGAVPKSTGFTGIVVCAYVRFAATLNSMAGFYTLQLNYGQEYKQGFLKHLTAENINLAQRVGQYKQLFLSKAFTADQAQLLANSMVAKTLGLQSKLLANRMIFLICGIIVAAVFFLLIAMAVSKKISSNKKLYASS